MAILRMAGTIDESIVDGKGIRYVVFVQGCPHKCDGCHNPQTHDFSAGFDLDTDEILNRIKKDKLLSGVTFSGGEPFCQATELAELGEKIKEIGLNITTYSGYTFEQLLEMSTKNPGIKRLLNVCDILIDGKFIIEEKNLMLKFRGSNNQRILDLKKSLEAQKAVEIEL
ncbi:MAG: anaerobic ribonucleoside-triphosphate reductase activating protein [Oscillospiraceae bacterium]